MLRTRAKELWRKEASLCQWEVIIKSKSLQVMNRGIDVIEKEQQKRACANYGFKRLWSEVGGDEGCSRPQQARRVEVLRLLDMMQAQRQRILTMILTRSLQHITHLPESRIHGWIANCSTCARVYTLKRTSKIEGQKATYVWGDTWYMIWCIGWVGGRTPCPAVCFCMQCMFPKHIPPRCGDSFVSLY